VHGAVLPRLQLLPRPGVTDGHAGGRDERSVRRVAARHRGVQEPGQHHRRKLLTLHHTSDCRQGPVHLREKMNTCKDIVILYIAFIDKR